MLSKFDVSSFFVTGDIDFQIGRFAHFEQFKVDVTLGKSKLTLFLQFTTLDKSQLFH